MVVYGQFADLAPGEVVEVTFGGASRSTRVLDRGLFALPGPGTPEAPAPRGG